MLDRGVGQYLLVRGAASVDEFSHFIFFFDTVNAAYKRTITVKRANLAICVTTVHSLIRLSLKAWLLNLSRGQRGIIALALLESCNHRTVHLMHGLIALSLKLRD